MLCSSQHPYSLFAAVILPACTVNLRMQMTPPWQEYDFSKNRVTPLAKDRTMYCALYTREYLTCSKITTPRSLQQFNIGKSLLRTLPLPPLGLLTDSVHGLFPFYGLCNLEKFLTRLTVPSSPPCLAGSGSQGSGTSEHGFPDPNIFSTAV